MGIDEVLAENAALKAENAELKDRLATLERLVRKNSTNSSSPPSSDPPGVSRKKKAPTGRKIGAQPGHKGHARVRVPPARVNRVVVYEIKGACACGSSKMNRVKVGRRHQVAEIPDIRAEVVEHQCMRGRCAGCGRRRHAALPLDVPTGCLGPRLQAHLATMSGAYQLSRREVEKYSHEVLHVDVCVGTVSATEEARVARATAPAYRELKAELKKPEHTHADETGFQRKATRTTTWIFSRLLFAVLCVGKDRGRRALFRGLGRNFAGTLSTDRYVVYDVIPPERRQLCWAHMLRVFVCLLDEGSHTARVGRRLLRAGQRVIHFYNRRRRGEVSAEVFDRGIRRCRVVLERLLGRNMDLPGLRTLAHAFWLTPASVWLFVTNDEVSPTNNQAERDLRSFVLRKKKSFFTQSWRGDRFVERMSTIVATCRKQKRNLFDFVVDTVAAALHGRTPPTLLPA